MRATVLVSEYLIYIPALVIFNRRLARICGLNVWESSIALMAILLQPSTILIDHAHFQYNTVMLGFTLASMDNMMADRFLWSCVFFVASLGFKQMALYYAPVVFAYLLGVCIQPKINIARLLAIAIITVISFAVVFAPLVVFAYYNHFQDPVLISTLPKPQLLDILLKKLPLQIDQDSILYPALLHLSQAVHRIFPLARGLFEDKVANVWCTIHTVYKLNRFSVSFLSRLSLLTTLVAITPSCLIILNAPNKKLIPYAFASCAWGFFLCSFQVHEKSVLLPLLPMTVLLGGEAGLNVETRAWVGWANILATWTMFPLLQRDELKIPYVVLTLLWSYLMGLPPVLLTIFSSNQSGISTATKILHGSFYAFMIGWHMVEAFIPPPDGKPDLWVVLNCIVGAIGFGICYLWCNWNLLEKSGLFKNLKAPTVKMLEKPVSKDVLKDVDVKGNKSKKG
jgi:alpha-1,3-glucosyltransferase